MATSFVDVGVRSLPEDPVVPVSSLVVVLVVVVVVVLVVVVPVWLLVAGAVLVELGVGSQLWVPGPPWLSAVTAGRLDEDPCCDEDCCDDCCDEAPAASVEPESEELT
ncbi:MAG TPA: hypothetical protein VHN80_08900, partial [Kineosporiaceae bacterium]|nr:hypothetical protein [Kineosporiaceae bacterium]